MRRLPPDRLRQTKYYTVPYIKALKVFAYADIKFDEAMSYLEGWGFYIPDKKHELKEIAKSWDEREKKWVPTYDIMKNKFDIMHYEALQKDRDFQFSPSEIENLGLSPFYEWFVAKEDAEITEEMRVMQTVISDIRNASMRRAVCVLTYQGKSPEDIWSILSNDPRGPALRWGIEHIQFFVKFFWDMSGMEGNPWIRYGNMMEIGGNDRHFEYIAPMIQGCSKRDITWHGGPFDRYDDLQAINLIMSRQLHYSEYDPNKEFKVKAGRAAAQSLAIKRNIMADIKASNVGTDKGPLEDVELLVKEEEDKQRSKVFAHVEEIDGEVSDPKDTEFDKDDYLEQK